MSHRPYDVTTTTDDPVPFPVVVDALVAAGCVVLGRIADNPEPVELDPRLAQLFSPETVAAARKDAERPAGVALRTPSMDAFVVVESVDDHLQVRVRTISTEGELIETVAGSSDAAETSRRAERRSVRQVSPTEDVLTAHRIHVENHRLTHPGRPVVHQSIDLLLDVWQWAAEHDDRLDRKADHVTVTTKARVHLVVFFVGGLALAGIGLLQSHLLVLLFGVAVALGVPVVQRGLTLAAMRPQQRPPFQARLRPEQRG